MAGGEDILYPYLNNWLTGKGGTPDGLAAQLDSDDHSVPQGPKDLAGSQNLFWLKAGAERLAKRAHLKNTDEQLIGRLKRERDVIGAWGSEQFSPIYHPFIITGAATVYVHTQNAELKDLIEENLATFFWGALNMGVGNTNLGRGLIGQRGTGHNFSEHGFPQLSYLIRYFMGGRPDNRETIDGWKPHFQDYGWLVGSLKGGPFYNLVKDIFERIVLPGYKPWGVMVPVHFLKVEDVKVGQYMERGANGNTPELGGYVNGTYLPRNENVRVRQKASHGEYTVVFYSESFSLNYSGIYNDLPGGSENSVVARTYKYPVRERVLSLYGLTAWKQIYPVVNTEPTPQQPTTPTVPANPNPQPPKDTRSFIQKLWDMLRGKH